MSDEQVKQLVNRLERKYQRQVKVQLTVEPELIGGVKITAGDEVFDATVRGKLDNMRAALTR
jgi:F-type H+-transporting ATPase subunit delta